MKLREARQILNKNGYVLYESFEDYNAIRNWIENVLEKANTMFNSCYVSKNGDTGISVEIEGYDSTDGDAIISIVWEANDTLEDNISSFSYELNRYVNSFDPEEEANSYLNSGDSSVPPYRTLLKAMKERKRDMVKLSKVVFNEK